MKSVGLKEATFKGNLFIYQYIRHSRKRENEYINEEESISYEAGKQKTE